MKILGCDYDGTLNYGGMTEEKLRAIEAWQRAGHKFGIVSGRGTDFRSSLLAEFPRLKPDFFAACSGAYIMDEHGQVLYEARCRDVPMPELARDLFAWNCKFIHINGGGYVCMVQDPADRPAWVDPDRVCLPAAASDIGFFNQVSVQLPTGAAAAQVVENIRQVYGTRLNPLQNGSCIDIVPVGVDKARGMYRVMEFFGGTYGDVITVGDNVNDMDMIREFRSYAMKNGVSVLQAAADAVIGDVTELLEREMA